MFAPESMHTRCDSNSSSKCNFDSIYVQLVHDDFLHHVYFVIVDERSSSTKSRRWERRLWDSGLAHNGLGKLSIN